MQVGEGPFLFSVCFLVRFVDESEDTGKDRPGPPAAVEEDCRGCGGV